MESLESELERARDLDVAAVADAVEAIGFECTRCGACCKGVEPESAPEDTEGVPASGPRAGGTGERDASRADGDDHTATVFPDEVRALRAATEYDWRDVARPMPFGLDGDAGETFEWALQTDDCGDCAFYEEFEDGGGPGQSGEGEGSDDRDGDDDTDEDAPDGRCTVYADRPLVCRTYPFSLALGGTDQPVGGVVERDGVVQAHECEGLGRGIDRADAEELARTLKERAVRELEEAVAVRDNYEPVDPGPGSVVVHDSEGAKLPDGTPLDGGS